MTEQDPAEVQPHVPAGRSPRVRRIVELVNELNTAEFTALDARLAVDRAMVTTDNPPEHQLFENLPKARPSSFRQWRALTARILRVMVRGELMVAVITPLIFTVGFYFPLRYMMQTSHRLGELSYAQFIMPIIVLQTIGVTMMSNAQLAAYEAHTGLSSRLQSMPIASRVPLAARIASGMGRSIASLIAAICYSYIIGFRFHAGIGQSALFCAFALAVGITLSLGADAMGNVSKNPESLSQALAMPVLIFGMLSCGFVPESGFPHWIRGFVRNQPISQFAFAMRDMTTTHGVSWHVLWVPLLWLGGLAAVFTPWAIWATGRRS